MPVEKSGQNEFDFEYGDDFAAHIEQLRPGLLQGARPLQPGRRPAMNKRQLERLKRLADWLHDNDRKFLFELLVPATDEQLASVDGDDRPLRRRAPAGADAPRDHRRSRTPGSRSTSGRSRASTSAPTPRCSRSRPGRARVARASTCVLLGRGASTEKVEHWLGRRRRSRASSASRSAARSGGTRSRAFLAKELDRGAAASQIADNYLHFVQVYEGQQVH